MANGTFKEAVAENDKNFITGEWQRCAMCHRTKTKHTRTVAFDLCFCTLLLLFLSPFLVFLYLFDYDNHCLMMERPRVHEDYYEENAGIIIRVDDDHFTCLLCDKQNMNCKKASKIDKHIKSLTHQQLLTAQKLNTSSYIVAATSKYAYFSVTDNGLLYCNICQFEFTGDSPNYERHAKCKRHTKFSKLVETKKSLSNMNDQEFNSKICEAFTVANIPLSKLDNPHLKNLLEAISSKPIRKSNSMRTHHLPKIAANYREQVIAYLQDKKVFLCSVFLLNKMLK